MGGYIMADDKETRELDERGRKGLGIRPSIYGLGTGFRNGLVTTGIVTTTMTVIGSALQFGTKWDIVKYIRYPKDLLEWAINRGSHLISKSPLSPEATHLPELRDSPKGGDRAATILTIAGASLGLAYLLSHIAQIPGFVQGTRKGKEAVRRYEAVVDENRRLKEENAELRQAADDSHPAYGSAAPAGYPQAASFSDRIQPRSGTSLLEDRPQPQPSFKDIVKTSRESSSDTQQSLDDF